MITSILIMITIINLIAVAILLPKTSNNEQEEEEHVRDLLFVDCIICGGDSPHIMSYTLTSEDQNTENYFTQYYCEECDSRICVEESEESYNDVTALIETIYAAREHNKQKVLEKKRLELFEQLKPKNDFTVQDFLNPSARND